MYLSVDIGGTKTLIALFSRHGRIVRKIKFKTAADFDDFVSELVSVLNGFSERRITAITVAIPGVVQKNCSFSFGNREWDGIDLLSPLRKLFDCPIWFENDANLAVLYESFRLPGRTVFLTFSTGIGGGIAENNKFDLSEACIRSEGF